MSGGFVVMFIAMALATVLASPASQSTHTAAVPSVWPPPLSTDVTSMYAPLLLSRKSVCLVGDENVDAEEFDQTEVEFRDVGHSVVVVGAAVVLGLVAAAALLWAVLRVKASAAKVRTERAGAGAKRAREAQAKHEAFLAQVKETTAMFEARAKAARRDRKTTKREALETARQTSVETLRLVNEKYATLERRLAEEANPARVAAAETRHLIEEARSASAREAAELRERVAKLERGVAEVVGAEAAREAARVEREAARAAELLERVPELERGVGEAVRAAAAADGRARDAEREVEELRAEAARVEREQADAVRQSREACEGVTQELARERERAAQLETWLMSSGAQMAAAVAARAKAEELLAKTEAAARAESLAEERREADAELAREELERALTDAADARTKMVQLVGSAAARAHTCSRSDVDEAEIELTRSTPIRVTPPADVVLVEFEQDARFLSISEPAFVTITRYAIEESATFCTPTLASNVASEFLGNLLPFVEVEGGDTGAFRLALAGWIARTCHEAGDRLALDLLRGLTAATPGGRPPQAKVLGAEAGRARCAGAAAELAAALCERLNTPEAAASATALTAAICERAGSALGAHMASIMEELLVSFVAPAASAPQAPPPPAHSCERKENFEQNRADAQRHDDHLVARLEELAREGIEDYTEIYVRSEDPEMLGFADDFVEQLTGEAREFALVLVGALASCSGEIPFSEFDALVVLCTDLAESKLCEMGMAFGAALEALGLEHGATKGAALGGFVGRKLGRELAAAVCESRGERRGGGCAAPDAQGGGW